MSTDKFYIFVLEYLKRRENALKNYRNHNHEERFDAFLLPGYI